MNRLRAFEAAGRHLNFRLAAEDLGVTQGAVAQQVRGLESDLSLRLFERLPRGLAFTEVGRIYHGQIAQAFEQIAEATRGLKPSTQKVTISVTPSFASRWLIPNLPEFTARYPDIDLRILATDRMSSFHSDGIDLAVRQGRPPFGAALSAQLLFRQEIIAVCAPSHPAQRQAQSGGGIAGLVLLHDTHDLWPRFRAEVLGSAPDTGQEQGLRFNQTALSVEAAIAGQGVALVSRFLVARDLEAGRLTQPVSGALTGERDFYLLMARQPRPSQAVQAVWNWLAAHGE